ncbi:MAG: flavodoxin family protein [Candidatus Omnitrophota bacterium]|nr:MAG: flavodoxin family protein [Candidatus Omnitrophota bacterium]
MKIVGIVGSPRKGGNSEILLDRLLEGASGIKEKEKLYLNSLNFTPCQECEDVRKDGICKIDDDFQLIYKKVMESDIIIISSPVFFGSLPAQVKMMIDRFHCLWLAKFLFKTVKDEKGKTGIFICVEATRRRDFFENARSIVKNFFVTVGASYRYELLCEGIERKGEVKEYPECLEEAYNIGKNLLKWI